MAFHDVRFPSSLSLGSVGGPERRTDIVTLASGHEERNTPWAQSRRRYDAGLGLRSLDDIADVIAFFEARRGRLHAFRWKDWSDWTSGRPSQPISPFDQALGTGDGAATQFQLIKTYASGGETVTRTIAKPLAGTVRVAVDGIEMAEGVDWSVDVGTGVVTLTAAPAIGAAVTAGFAFDVPVRFDVDRLDVSISGFEAGEVPDIPVVEVRL